MTRRAIDLTSKRFGKLVAQYPIAERRRGRVVWHCQCDCGNTIDATVTELNRGDTTSCGCLKKEMNKRNLRDQYDNKRIDNVVKPLFKDKTPRKDSTVGYRGVSKYYTRITKELRYRAWITVNGKRHYKAGFKTAEEAYYNGRLVLEQKYLPFNHENK
jgi:hypothetical protein